MPRPLTRIVLLVVAGLVQPAVAWADWSIYPFIGVKFAGQTSLIDLERGAGDTKLTIGVSGLILGEGILGVEADVGYSPRFFERSGGGGLVARSNVTTLMGNAIFAMPRALSGAALRPFAVGGVGLIHVGVEDVLELFPINSNLFGFVVGGGVIGPLTPRTSVRFDLRHFRNITHDTRADPGPFGARTDLSFWRASAGLTLRY